MTKIKVVLIILMLFASVSVVSSVSDSGEVRIYGPRNIDKIWWEIDPGDSLLFTKIGNTDKNLLKETYAVALGVSNNFNSLMQYLGDNVYYMATFVRLATDKIHKDFQRNPSQLSSFSYQSLITLLDCLAVHGLQSVANSDYVQQRQPKIARIYSQYAEKRKQWAVERSLSLVPELKNASKSDADNVFKYLSALDYMD